MASDGDIHQTHRRRHAWPVAAALLAILPLLAASAVAPVKPRPKPVLWAWERPEDLSYVDPGKVDIAAVVATVELAGNRAVLHIRTQTLRLPPGADYLPVIHVEISRSARPALDDTQRHAFVVAILRSLSGLAADRLQIDFEARPSQREFYAAALAELRTRLPRSHISITALASWCMYEDWTRSLPVDEIVPMLFRMGHGSAAEYAIDGGGDFRQSNCRSALGIATDEPRQRLPSGRRIYVFNPKSWTQRFYQALLREAELWR